MIGKQKILNSFLFRDTYFLFLGWKDFAKLRLLIFLKNWLFLQILMVDLG
jgi:hypothetical protein